MFKKEIKYGYSTGDGRLAKPSIFTNIRLTPRNNKFIFNGTRHDILKWMNSHSELLVEYDPTDQDIETSFSPLSSPLLSIFPDIPEIPLSSPTSITSTLSTLSTNSINSDSSSEKPHDMTFDLFAVPAKTTILPEDPSFSKSLNIALKCIPWIEVTLEIRPTDERKDSKLYPMHRVILPSGSSLSEISKALEKSWKSLIPDQTAFGPDCFIRNSELLYPPKTSESDSDVEYHEKRSNKFTFGMDLFRQKQDSDEIPPGILTPYIIEDVLGELEDKKEEEIVKEQIHLDKRKEAELEKGLPMDNLPKYETSFGDVLLESARVYR